MKIIISKCTNLISSWNITNMHPFWIDIIDQLTFDEESEALEIWKNCRNRIKSYFKLLA